MFTIELGKSEAEILLTLIKGQSIVPAERRHIIPIELLLENLVESIDEEEDHER